VAQSFEREVARLRVQSAAEAALVGVEFLTLASPVEGDDFVLEIDGEGWDVDALHWTRNMLVH
jgi:hypothetical protein